MKKMYILSPVVCGGWVLFCVCFFLLDECQAESFPSIMAKISSTIKALLTIFMKLHETEQITGHSTAWRYFGTVMVAVVKMCLYQ